jgi:hypothetical protein
MHRFTTFITIPCDTVKDASCARVGQVQHALYQHQSTHTADAFRWGQEMCRNAPKPDIDLTSEPVVWTEIVFSQALFPRIDRHECEEVKHSEMFNVQSKLSLRIGLSKMVLQALPTIRNMNEECGQ